MKNEVGTDIPPEIERRAREKGCHQGIKYVYKDGNYGDKYPAASIGGQKATRFRNLNSANSHKVQIGKGWVAFESPSHKGYSSQVRIQSKDISTIEKRPENKLSITRETEFFQGFVCLKMSVCNEASLVCTDVVLDFDYDEDILRMDRYEPKYKSRNEKVKLGNIPSNDSKTVTIWFEPMTCVKSSTINCLISYKDAGGRLQTTQMKPKNISVVCPIMKTDSDINIGRLKELIESLPCKDSRTYKIKTKFDIKELVYELRKVIKRYDIKHLRTLHTIDEKNYEMWFYSKTKVNKTDIVIKIGVSYKEKVVELFAATETAESLTGLLSKTGREVHSAIEREVQSKGTVNQIINLTIKDSIVQRSNLLNSCDMEGNCTDNVVIEDSIFQRSTVGKQTPLSNVGEVYICRVCDTKLSSGSNFCHSCGEQINNKPSTPALPNKSKQTQGKAMINKLNVRKYLIDSAAKKQIVTYKEFKDHFELPYMIQAFNHLKQMSNECIQKGEPLLSAIVVNDDGLPGKGFWDDRTSKHLNYQGSSKDVEARNIHKLELERVFSWNWK